LYWLNRHYIKEKPVGQLATIARPFFETAGLLPKTDDAQLEAWFDRILALLAPSVDRLDQLPERSPLIFHYDAQAALASPGNAEVLALPHTDAVIARFTAKILEDESAKNAQLTPERFKQIVNEVKAETGAKGKELFHPIRIIVTGSHSGPEFDKLIPILDEGSRLNLPKHVLSVRERVEEFAKAWGR
jgi:nondiscriminating glutamyl-tRNA synthetase